jgi:hypothetical protein
MLQCPILVVQVVVATIVTSPLVLNQGDSYQQGLAAAISAS